MHILSFICLWPFLCYSLALRKAHLCSPFLCACGSARLLADVESQQLPCPASCPQAVAVAQQPAKSLALTQVWPPPAKRSAGPLLRHPATVAAFTATKMLVPPQRWTRDMVFFLFTGWGGDLVRNERSEESVGSTDFVLSTGSESGQTFLFEGPSYFHSDLLSARNQTTEWYQYVYHSITSLQPNTR